MKKISRTSRWLRWPRLAVGLAVMATAAALLTWAQSSRSASSASAAAQNSEPQVQSKAPTLVKTAVAADGQAASTLVYPSEVKAVVQISVLPKASGRIEKMMVDVGSRVKKGDVIAEMEAASLRAQVSQAKANLASAQAKYASLADGPRQEQVAQAGANLDSARQKLSAMEAGSRDEQIAQAQAALDQATARRDQLVKGATESQIAATQSAVDAARANLASAKARLETVQQGPTQTEWGTALAALETARANVKKEQANLDDVMAGPKDADLWTARQAVEAAQATLYAANDKVATWKGTSSDAEKMSTGATSASNAVKQLEAAQTNLDAATARLNQLKAYPLPIDVARAQATFEGAKAAVEAANAKVEQMKRGATPQEVAQAQAAVDSAAATLASAEAALKQQRLGPTDEDVMVVEAAVANAEQTLLLAQNPYRDQDISQLRNAVTVAQQQYSLAAKPYTEHDLEMAQAAVMQAEAALEMAEIGAGEAKIVSLVDGIVSERLQSVGSMANPSSPIVTLMSQDIELSLSVEEAKVWLVKEGQEAEISATAHPGTAFKGKVTAIAPAADPKSRTFQVKIRPEDPDSKLRPGMFAQVKIAPTDKTKSVLVPKDGVLSRSGQNVVLVVKGEAVQQRTVSTKPTKNGMVEISSGLEAGEEIVVAGSTDLQDGDRIRKG